MKASQGSGSKSSKKKKSDAARGHRIAERNAVQMVRYFLRRRNYMAALRELAYALEQATAADAKEASNGPMQSNSEERKL